MDEPPVNPLVPAGFDIAWSIVGVVLAIAALALLLGALWSIAASRRLATAGRLLWVLVVLAFPLLGPLSWFAWGRTARLDRGVA